MGYILSPTQLLVLVQVWEPGAILGGGKQENEEKTE